MATPPRKTLLIRQKLGLQTRLANDITNEFNPGQPGTRDQRVCAKWKADFPGAIPRTTAASYGYNCHGLTFASRRTQVWSSVEVQHILNEDGYKTVAKQDAMPGDIAIYQSTESGEIEHSAIVVEPAKDLRGPRVVSKWGPCEEYIHYYTECPYTPSTITFHRIHK